MNLGVLVTGHVASRAIVSEARRAGHIVRGIDLGKLSDTESGGFDAIILANVFDPTRIATLLRWVSPACHVIFVSTHLVLPSGLSSIPWSEEDFDSTSESLAEAGEAEAARLAERTLMLAGQDVNWTILRPAIVEGPHDPDPLHTRWFVERSLSSGPIVLPDEDEQPYRHVSTRDLGRAIMAVLGAPTALGKVLHVCSDGILTPSLQALAVADALGSSRVIQYVSGSAWDRVGLARPMAGRTGSALLAPSATLAELGWVPTPPMRFIRNLALELREQPRRLTPEIRSKELSLAVPERPGSVARDNGRVGWVLRTTRGDGHGIVAAPQVRAEKPWRTIAVALGQDVQRNASRLNALGLDRALAAPMLVEEVRRKGRQRRKLVFGEFAMDSLDETATALDIPEDLGDAALFVFPLGVLLASWPKELPEGEVWVLGRGMEAWLAAALAIERNRKVRLLGTAREPPAGDRLPEIEPLAAKRAEAPALVLNVSGGSIKDEQLGGNLLREGVLVSPELYRSPLALGRSIRPLIDLPDRETLLRALDLINDWKVEKRHPNCFCQLSRDDLGSAFIAPAFQLPVLSGGALA